ncbi:unnamed protein product [Leptosia nina]|uniref:Allatostatin CC n=1 Tax=Leptosia nina TaxID=320188 RepID=A0AAV1K5A3_9NEOP
MMSLPLIISVCVALASAFPASVKLDEDYPRVDLSNLQEENYFVPQKRAALVLDRLLVALQKALREESTPRFDPERDGPRTAPLRLAHYDGNDLTGLQRRGQGNRGRVLRCYFNAITCF